MVVLFATPFTLERARSGYLYHKHKPRFVLLGPDSVALLPPAGAGTSLTRMVYRLASPWYLPYFLERRLSPALVSPRPPPPRARWAMRSSRGRSARPTRAHSGSSC